MKHKLQETLNQLKPWPTLALLSAAAALILTGCNAPESQPVVRNPDESAQTTSNPAPIPAGEPQEAGESSDEGEQPPSNPESASGEESQDLIGDFKLQKLSEIASVYRVFDSKYQRLRQLYLSLDQLGQSPREIEGIPEVVIDGGRKELEALELYVKKLAATNQNCLNDSSEMLDACTLPTQPLLRMLNLIDFIAFKESGGHS